MRFYKLRQTSELLEVKGFGPPARIDAGTKQSLFKTVEPKPGPGKTVAQSFPSLGKSGFDNTSKKSIVFDHNAWLCKSLKA